MRGSGMLLLFFAITLSCANSRGVFKTDEKQKMSSSAPRRIILDTDIGLDDAFAVLTLLYAEKLGLVKIEAIVCTMGNADINNVCKNTVRLLETVNRTDIPVYRGSTGALVAEATQHLTFGSDGFGNLEYEDDPNLEIIQKLPASIAMQKIVKENPGEISLVCIGPLTNVALAMKLFDDFAENVKDVFILGGNHPGAVINETEYNFLVDPEAAYIVFKNAAFPITITPLETCVNTSITFDWRYNVLGKQQSGFMDLLNRAEKSAYNGTDHDEAIWYPFDTILSTVMLFPEESIVQDNKYNVKIELSDTKIKGQIVLDECTEKEKNVRIVEEIGEEFVKEMLLKAAAVV